MRDASDSTNHTKKHGLYHESHVQLLELRGMYIFATSS